MTLTNADIHELTDFRHALHRRPEVSGAERETAATIAAALALWHPTQVLTGLGGHGVAAVYDSGTPGPTVMFRAELDALPIHELGEIDHASEIPGTAHLCGHDGHMTILMALARLLHRAPPKQGRVILMFQPAEENGAGAAAVVADPRYGQIVPDWAFAIHNMPGCARGAAWLAEGVVNCASAGLRIILTGATAHASLPETGRAPTPVIARLIDALAQMGPGGALGPGFRLATITHIEMGEPVFGIAPGRAELWVTLRGITNADLDAVMAQARDRATDLAAAQGLRVDFEVHDHFHACHNEPQATAYLARAAQATGIAYDTGDLPERASEDFGLFGGTGGARADTTPAQPGLPMRGSEDFGRFGEAGARSAMLYLGSGVNHPALHTETYDFPDELIAQGARIFDHVRRALNG